MKKNYFFISLLCAISIALPALTSANPGAIITNAKVHEYDAVNKDLILLLDNLPFYFLVSLTGSECEGISFVQNEPVNISITTAVDVHKINTQESCRANRAIQIKNEQRTVVKIDPSGNSMRTIDANARIHQMWLAEGCENASNYLGQKVYVATGLGENMLFLPNGDGKCIITNVYQVN